MLREIDSRTVNFDIYFPIVAVVSGFCSFLSSISLQFYHLYIICLYKISFNIMNSTFQKLKSSIRYLFLFYIAYILHCIHSLCYCNFLLNYWVLLYPWILYIYILIYIYEFNNCIFFNLSISINNVIFQSTHFFIHQMYSYLIVRIDIIKFY